MGKQYQPMLPIYLLHEFLYSTAKPYKGLYCQKMIHTVVNHVLSFEVEIGKVCEFLIFHLL